MNLGREARPLTVMPDEAQREIETIDRLWSATRAQFGASGPYLFGTNFTNVDIMFAPVVSRFTSYGVALSPIADAYRAAVLDHPLMREWQRLAALEPVEWQLERYESVA